MLFAHFSVHCDTVVLKSWILRVRHPVQPVPRLGRMYVALSSQQLEQVFMQTTRTCMSQIRFRNTWRAEPWHIRAVLKDGGFYEKIQLATPL